MIPASRCASRKVRTLVLVGTLLSVSALRAEPTGTAADIVPADCAYFSTSIRLKEQFDAVAQSRAVRRVLELPLVQGQIAEMQGRPEYQQFLQFLEIPLAKDASEAGLDAISREVFLYSGAGWDELLKIVQDFQYQNFMQGMSSAFTKQEPKPAPVIISTLLSHPKVKVPATVIGFKIADRARFERLLAEVKNGIEKNSKLKVEPVKLGAGDYHTLRLAGDLLPIPKDKVIEGLTKEGVSESQAEKFVDWMKEQALSITMGFHGSYFLVSIGADNSHLEKLGKAAPLSDSKSLAPIRKHLSSQKVISLSYISEQMASIGQMNPKEMQEGADKLLGQFGVLLPKDLGPRLSKDVRQFLKDVEDGLAKPSEIVGVSLLDRGVETYQYCKSPQPGADYSKSLAILQHAGPKPMLAYARGTKSSKQNYEKAAELFKKLFGYWTDYGVGFIPETEKEKYKQVEAIALAYCHAMDEITRTKFNPAVDAAQCLFVMDTKLRAQRLGPEVNLPKPMPFPELAFALSLNDGDLFKQAVAGYIVETEKLIQKLSPIFNEPRMGDFTLPRPAMEPVPAGEMFSYLLPPFIDKAILPHAIVGKKLLIVGIAPSMSQRMSGTSSAPANEKVSLGAPSASVVYFQTEGFWEAVKEWIAFAEKMPGNPMTSDKNAMFLIKQHLNTGLDLLGTFKGVASRSYQDGDFIVIHSWAQFEDVAPK